PDSRWAWYQPRSWLKPARGHAGLYSFTPVYRSPSLGKLGQRNCLFKSMAWMLIRSLLERVISTRLGHSLHQPPMPTFSSTRVINIILRIVRFHPTTLRQPPFY